MPELIAFLDTNTFLHFPRLDQLDWLALLHSTGVRLIIAPVVIRELNRHKDSPTSLKTRERAAAVLRVLDEWSERAWPVFIRNGVELHFRVQDPLIDFAKFNLSRDIADDHLIASILEYNIDADPGATRLVTADLGLKLKAKSHGISVDQLPAGLRLPDELLPEEKKRRELESEVMRLRNRLPKVKLLFNTDGPQLRVQLPALNRPKLETPSAAEVRAKHPKMEVPRVKQPRSSEQLLASLNGIPAEDIEKYNEQLDLYYAAYAEYVVGIERVYALLANTARLDILAVNEGTCPAEGLDIFLHFPDGFALVTESGLPKIPQKPNPPRKPETLAERMASAFQLPSVFARAPSFNLPDTSRPTNVSTPRIRRTKSYDVNVSIATLKHGFVESLEAFYVMFDSGARIGSFTIDYSIHASNLPDPSEGQLHVIINGPSTNALDHRTAP
jgi:PIN domain